MALHTKLPIYKIAYDLLDKVTDAIRSMPRDFKDRLWVREAYRVPAEYDHLSPSNIPRDSPILYLADDFATAIAKWGRYRHGRFMPRGFSRILLENTGVRIEQLGDISEEDATAEGVERIVIGDGWRRYGPTAAELAGLPPCATARESYRSLWECINGSWDPMQWVWVVEFKRIEG